MTKEVCADVKPDELPESSKKSYPYIMTDITTPICYNNNFITIHSFMMHGFLYAACIIN